jgi:thiamine-monophosphate kinase
MALSITALGEGDKEDLVYRSGAKKNDLICVSGDLGAAYLGLQLLEREKKIFLENPEAQPELEGYDYLLQRQLETRGKGRHNRIFQRHIMYLPRQ